MHVLLARIQRAKLDFLIVFVVAFTLLSYIQLSRTIGDPDGFYHAKIAEFLKQGIILKSLPWMQFSTLRDSFTDHHFLYHIFLVPFLFLGNSLLAVKLATVFFGAVFFAVFYWALKRFYCNAPFFWTALLLFSSPFIFRLGLVKANSLSLIIFFCILVALFEKRWLRVAILQMIYVWLYGGWLLGWVASFVFFLCDFFYGRIYRHHRPWFAVFLFLRRSTNEAAWKLVVATIAGTVGGLMVNPYWPHNLFFYWQQIWQISIVNLGSAIDVGGEWSHYPLKDLLTALPFVGIFFFIGSAIVIMHAPRLKLRTWLFLILSILCIAFTVKSRRYIELSVPTMIFFAACAWSDIFPTGIIRQLWQSWKTPASWIRIQFALSVCIGMGIFFITPNHGFWAQIQQSATDLAGGIPLHRYEKVSRWLAAHTPLDSIVVQSDWDDWPVLFYYNTHNRYLVGLDPTFMYNYDQGLYQRWARLSRDGVAEDVVSLVHRDLKAQYAMIEKDHTAMQRVFSTNIYFRLIYEDDEAWVYQYIESIAAALPTLN